MKILHSLCRIVVAVAIGSALLAGAAGFGVTRYGAHKLGRAEADFEARHGSLNLNSYRPPPVSPSDNGAALMALAGSRIKLTGRTSDLVSLASISSRHDWSQETAQMVAMVTADHRDAMALLHFAATLPAADFGPSEQHLNGAATNFILGLLSGARILAANARDQFVAHDVASFERSVRSLGALAAALSRELDLNYQMAGWTAENLLLALAREVVESEHPHRRELLALRDAGGTTDLMDDFRRYLCWRAAMAVDEPINGGRGSASDQSQLDPPARNPIDRRILALTRDLRTALELEEYRKALDRLLVPAAKLVRSESNGDELFAEFNLAAGRVQTTDTSRRVVAFAVQLRLANVTRRGDLIASASYAELPLTGEGLLITAAEDGSCLVTIRGAKEHADRLFFGRFNPTPPLRVLVPATPLL